MRKAMWLIWHGWEDNIKIYLKNIMYDSLDEFTWLRIHNKSTDNGSSSELAH
jgi:hypothetical protein